MVECFFLLRHSLVVEDYKLSSSKCAINSDIRLVSCILYIGPSLSFSSPIFSLAMYCVRLLYELVILLSTHNVTKHLTCHNKLRSNVLENISTFHLLLFEFEVSRFGT